MNILQRYWKNVDVRQPDECWAWKAGKDKDGYGKFRTGGRGGGKHVRAHRFIFMVFFGVLPPSILVCHTCDNPGCCNLFHMFKGTSQDNMDDKVAKNRQSHVHLDHRGERNPKARFTEDDVREIRRLSATGNYTYSQIGALYGLSARNARSRICEIVLRKSWKEVI